MSEIYSLRLFMAFVTSKPQAVCITDQAFLLHEWSEKSLPTDFRLSNRGVQEVTVIFLT